MLARRSWEGMSTPRGSPARHSRVCPSPPCLAPTSAWRNPSLGSAELLPHLVPPGSSSCPGSLWVTTWRPPASHLLLALPETLLASPDSDLRPGLVAVPCSPTPALLLTPARPSAPGVCCPGCLGCSLDTGLILHLHPKDLSPPCQGWRVTTDPGSAWRLERPYSDPAAL